MQGNLCAYAYVLFIEYTENNLPMSHQLVITESPTQEYLIDLISYKLNVPSSYMHPLTSLKEDLDLDPVDLLLLIVELESRFQVYLSPEEVEAIETIQDASFFFQKNAA